MRDIKKLFFVVHLLLVFLFFSQTSAFGELEVTHRKTTLTGIKTELQISGISPKNKKPTLYQIFVDEKIATSGIAIPQAIKTFNISFNDSGIKKIKVVFGKQNAQSSIRCLPGWVALLPPLIAIILALITKEVISSLFLGVWLGSTLLYDYNPFFGFLRALDKYVLGSLADPGHAAIIIFSVGLGGMIGVINKTGGMMGIVNLISNMVKGPRSAQFATWLMGVLIFFDDYANTLIVGNSMRSVTDKNKISREKLSYLVDSTAAPVAGIAVLSTWIGYEIGLIRQAFVDLNIPETNFYGIFLQTIPFRFYCILALFFGLIIAITRRDFGPMLHAEERALNEGKPLADDAKPISSPESAMPELPEEMPKRWYNAAIPIAVVIFGAFIGLLGNGGMFASHYDILEANKTLAPETKKIKIISIKPDLNLFIASSDTEEYAKYVINDKVLFDGHNGFKAMAMLKKFSEGQILYVKTQPSIVDNGLKVRAAFSDADSTQVLIWVSIIGSILAILLGMIQGLITLDTGTRAWVDGVRTLSMAFCLMVLAWSINSICKDLKTAEFIVEMVTEVIPYWLLPTIIFILACLISFATGTSWGTMAILLPISIPLAYHLNMKHYQEVISATPNAPEMIIYLKQMILVSIGAVLEGSIFGDHCSPISDTTIMSSMASGADHIDHVKTQAPYAAIVGLVAITICYIPAGYGISPMYLLPFSMGILIAFVHFFGKKVTAKK